MKHNLLEFQYYFNAVSHINKLISKVKNHTKRETYLQCHLQKSLYKPEAVIWIYVSQLGGKKQAQKQG